MMSRRLQWTRQVVMLVGTKNVCRIVVEKPRTHLLGRVKGRWEKNIRMDLREIICKDQR
jgi:hypothetical protein